MSRWRWYCGALGVLVTACGGSDSDPEVVIDNGATVPFEAGEAIEAPELEWTYVHFPDAKCRDGSETGMGININPDSDKLLIYMEGGGACFNAITCLANPSSWGETNLGTPGGALSREGDNPFKDWNLVYMPYCSGDVFTGAAKDGTGYDGDTMQGYVNVGEYLKRIVPTFEGTLDEVVLSGSSAGGFGAIWNWLRTQDAFGDVPVHLLDDSGPPLAPDYMSLCWQAHIADVWNWKDSVYPACEQCDVESGDVAMPMLEMGLARQRSDEATGDRRLALLTNNEDGVIKTFLAYGLNDCADFEPAGLLPPAYPVGLYPEGLADLRDRTADLDTFAMFQINGGGHTFLGGSYTDVEADGATLLDFLTAFRDGGDDFRHRIEEAQ